MDALLSSEPFRASFGIIMKSLYSVTCKEPFGKNYNLIGITEEHRRQYDNLIGRLATFQLEQQVLRSDVRCDVRNGCRTYNDFMKSFRSSLIMFVNSLEFIERQTHDQLLVEIIGLANGLRATLEAQLDANNIPFDHII